MFSPEPPAQPEKVKISNIGSETVLVSWKPSHDGNSKITNYIVEYRETPGHSHSLYWAAMS